MIPDWLSRQAAESLASGISFTIALTLITSGAAFCLALIVASTRFSPSRLVQVAGSIYTEIFRNVPTLIQIIFWAFAFPSLFSPELRRQIFFNNWLTDFTSAATGLALPYYALAACLGLTLNTSAHLADVLRSGMQAVPQERLDAASTMGASRWPEFLKILVPDSIRSVFPAISSRLIHNMKNTALASFVAVPELFHQTQASITKTFLATEFLLTAAVLYLGLSGLMTLLLDAVDRYLHRRSEANKIGSHGVRQQF